MKFSFDEIRSERGFILLYQFNLFAQKCETSEITVYIVNRNRPFPVGSLV